MANLDPPSFSLGLDLDFEPDPPTPRRENPPSHQPSQSSPVRSLFIIEEDDEDNFASPSPPLTLKRLRRGSISAPRPTVDQLRPVELSKADDDIEEFSSQEDLLEDELLLRGQYSLCSSSKWPLHRHGTSLTRSENHCNASKNMSVLETPPCPTKEISRSQPMFRQLTVSPLRKFQLIDSDSDDNSKGEGANIVSSKEDSHLTKGQLNSGQRANGQKENTCSISRREDLWRDFYTDKSFSIPTPALDEFCEEYFHSVKGKNCNLYNHNSKNCESDSIINEGNVQHWDLSSPPPPAHRYFFHDDRRIQKLVLSRLPHFLPLGAMNDNGHQQQSASGIDYMGQFNHGQGSTPASCKNSNNQGSARVKKSKKSNIESSQVSGGWVNPKLSTKIPKDAGKRRVHAVGKSGGHWYTVPGGKKVYISSNGHELTGQPAYRCHRKESGAGFKKSKRKTTAKKKTKR